MVILHGGRADGQFHLWGEAAAERAAPGAGRCGARVGSTRRAAAAAKPHPLDAGSDDLFAALERSAIGLKPDRRKVTPMAAWIPARGGEVVPSSPLVGDAPASRAAAKIVPRTVTAISLSAAESLDLLRACAGRQTLAPGVVVGPDLAFWAEATRFGSALVIRQRCLPSVAARDGAFCAQWEPIMAGADAERVRELADRMPPAARALANPDAAESPVRPAIEILKEALAETTDHLMRAGANGRTSAAGGDPYRKKTTSRNGRSGRKRRAFDSAHQQWLHALRSFDGVMHGDPKALSDLTEQVDAWRRPLSLTEAASLRLCFRLEPPPDTPPADAPPPPPRSKGRNGWYVRYLLQPVGDPSLLMPAGEAWSKSGRRRGLPAALAGVAVREFLLASLGQAAAICPDVERSLRAAEPAGYRLDVGGAHRFLSERAALLEASGFGVMLPAWWTGKGTRLRLAARAVVKSPRMQGGGGLSLDELVRFEWNVALGGEALSAAELEKLARLKVPLVKVRGQWVELTAEEIRAAIAFWKKKGGERATLREIVHMALGAGEAPGGIEIAGVQAAGAIGDLLRRLEEPAGFDTLPAPEGLVGKLRPYQVRGYSWLSFLKRWGLGACLADDMGLGKTIQMLALIQRDRETAGRRPVLIVCPTSVVGNWRREAERFTPGLPVLVHHGPERQRGAALARAARRQAMVITSYALLQRDAAQLGKIRWAGMVLDEAQNIKNPETRQARAARSIAAGYRVALTGTPVENNVGDLWSIMEFLNPGWLGTQTEFKRSFFVPIQAGRDVEAAARLRRLTGPLILRRLKTDRTIIRDLPKKFTMKVFCTLTKEQVSLYAAVLREADEALNDAEGIRRRGVILATLARLKQVCNHPAHFLADGSRIAGRSGKLARLSEMLEEVLAAGEAALLFSQFAEMGTILKRHLEESFGREVPFLHGGIARRERERMVDRFQAEGGPPLFVLSLKAGGTGLNLTRASHVFHFDRWWNPAVEDQATDRAFRIGQRRNVQVRKFVCAGTLEEKIDEMIERKKGVAAQVIGSGEAWLTELSNDELRGILALRAEAVGD